MPSSIASKYDASMACPLGKNSANGSVSNGLCYHPFYDDAGKEHDIFVPPGKEQEINAFDQTEDWECGVERCARARELDAERQAD